MVEPVLRPKVWLLQRSNVTGGTKHLMDEIAARLNAREIEASAVYLRDVEQTKEARRSALSALAQSISQTVGLITRLWRERPRVVVTFTPAIGSLAALATLPIRSVRVVSTHHADADKLAGPIRLLDKVLGRMGAFDQIVACSHSVADSFEANGEPYMRRLMVIENGVPTTTTPHLGSRHSELKHDNDIPEDLSVAFAAGRLAPQKNYAVILQALALAPRWSLVLAGAGPLEQELKEQAATLGVAERVRFVGVQPKSVINKYLSMCDAFVQSSLYEGLSLSVLEAMAHGAPCVVSDIASNTHALTTEDGAVGWLLPTDSPERWAATLDFVRDNPEQARAKGRDARAHQQQHYDEDGMYAKYLALITERALA